MKNYSSYSEVQQEQPLVKCVYDLCPPSIPMGSHLHVSSRGSDLSRADYSLAEASRGHILNHMETKGERWLRIELPEADSR